MPVSLQTGIALSGGEYAERHSLSAHRGGRAAKKTKLKLELLTLVTAKHFFKRIDEKLIN